MMRRRNSLLVLLALSLVSVGWIAFTYRFLRAPGGTGGASRAANVVNGLRSFTGRDEGSDGSAGASGGVIETKLEGFEFELRKQRAEITRMTRTVQSLRERRQPMVKGGGADDASRILNWLLPPAAVVRPSAAGAAATSDGMRMFSDPAMESLSLPALETSVASRRRQRVIPVLLFACNRLTVRRPIEQLLALRPSAERFPIIISADCNHQLTLSTIRAFGTRVQLMQQPDQSEYRLPLKQKKFKGYYAIARHYGWALNRTFVDFNYDAVIIVEDDLEVAPDFFSYFESLLPILEADPTLYCVSAWNDNGKASVIDSTKPELLHRTDFFPGLGWMLTRQLWTSELMHSWPKAFWDDWIREPNQRRNRACIRPEVSRTKTFGKIGVSNGLFFDKHLKHIQLSKQFVNFGNLNLSYLLKDNYDVEFVKRVYGSPVVTLSSLLDGSAGFGGRAVRLTYANQSTFKRLAKALSIMDDFRSGVPRTGYRGVVSCMYRGRRVYVAPPAEWNGYDPKWS